MQKKEKISSTKITEKKISNPNSFFQFLNKKEQRIELGIFFSILLAFFILFERFYPFLFTFPDTGMYIVSAVQGVHGGYRPMGFSNFLAFLNGINSSYYFFYLVQFWLLAASSLFFILSVKYFYFSRLIQNTTTKGAYYLFAFFVLTSPSLIFCTKYVMTEVYFNVWTSVLLATAVWLLFRRNWLMLVIHIIALYLASQTRYIGMIYVVVSLFVFLFTFKERKWVSILLLVCAVSATILSYNNTKNQMEKTFGVRMFSAFGGWTAANNVLVLMPEMKEISPEEIKCHMARYVHEEMVKIPDSLFCNERLLATRYIWDNENSLKNVIFRYINEFQMPYFRAWVRVGAFMRAYANYWQKEMPIEFAKRFYLLNLGQVFKHFPIEQNLDFIPDQTTKDFFNLSDDDKMEQFPTFFIDIDPLRKIGHYLLWIATGLALIIWGWKRKWFSAEQHKILGIIALFCAAYIGASVIGHPINNFRYFLAIYIPNLFFVFAVLAIVLLKFSPKK